MYASTGERIEQLERFHPERMASRILGMGDVLSLIEKAESVSDADQAAELERKIRKQQFTLEDFLQQMKQVRKMGPLQNVLGMMPGMGKAMKQIRSVNVDERELDRLEAIILSMTPAERANPTLIDGSRRKRIAQGSGTTVQAVNQLVKQFGQMRKMMSQLAKGKMPDPAAADDGACAEPVSLANLSRRNGRTNQTQKGGFEEEPDVAHRRRRQALAARRAHDRDDRPLQPADRALGDRGRRGARAALARPRRAALATRSRRCCARRASRPRLLAGPARALRGSPMRELVEFLVRALVADPDAVRVEEIEEDADGICSRSTSPTTTSAA